MRNSIRVLLLVSLTFTIAQRRASAQEPTDIEPPPVIKVATLNCEFLVKKKVHIKFGMPFNPSGAAAVPWKKAAFRDARLKEASQAVAKIIRSIDADAIALVEVGEQAEVELLRDEVAALGLRYDHLAVGDSTDSITGQHVAVLSKHPFEKIVRKIAGRESYLQEDDDPESEKDTGISKGLHVMFKVRGRRINVFVVHLASEKGGAEQDKQRIAQASIVRRTYLKALDAGEHVVVLGDFNDHRGQPTLRRLRGLDDIFPDLIQTGGPVFNRKRSKESIEQFNARLATHWSFQFAGQRNQIDHILISLSIRGACKRGGVNIEFVDTSKATLSAGKHRVTDHRGVALTLELKK
jgi:endonuclease/exonuclease/phosphatase family metal-dependent hydrolase